MIELRDRSREHVIEYWNKTQNEEIEKLFPRNISSLDEALYLFEESQKVGASSFGQTIYINELYIGDIWVFGIDEINEKMAMLSIVIFEKTYWGQGIGTEVISKFCKVCFEKYKIEKLGAFVYESNIRSIKALEKSNFEQIESFVEDGVASYYYELQRKLV